MAGNIRWNNYNHLRSEQNIICTSLCSSIFKCLLLNWLEVRACKINVNTTLGATLEDICLPIVTPQLLVKVSCQFAYPVKQAEASGIVYRV